MHINKLFYDTLEAILNRYLSADSELFVRLKLLVGKVIKFEFTSTPIVFFIRIGEHRVYLFDEYLDEIDATVAGTPFAILRMWQSHRNGRTKFDEDVVITGDTHVAQKFTEALQQIDIDWEEKLSKFIGDVAAHNISNMARKVQNFVEDNLQRLQSNLSEYLQEEARIFPGKIEIDLYLNAVDEFRDDVERIDAKISKLLKNSNDENS